MQLSGEGFAYYTQSTGDLILVNQKEKKRGGGGRRIKKEEEGKGIRNPKQEGREGGKGRWKGKVDLSERSFVAFFLFLKGIRTTFGRVTNSVLM